MQKKIWIVIILTIIIVILAGLLIFLPKDLFNKNGNSDVKVFSLKAGQEIISPLIVEGEAKGNYYFEATFPIRITDESGNVLGSSFVQAQKDWMTESFVPFKGEITYTSTTGGKGFVVFAKDNPSGLPQYDKEFKLPVILKPAGMTKIKVYFNNNKLDPEISCNKVFAVDREIPKIEAIGSAAINELLKGPTSADTKAGYFTSLNSGIKLQSLAIDQNGTAKVDFDEQLQAGVGGSCKVSAIRAQIEQTLKQFPTIKNVIISIDGRIEDILQP